VPALLYRSEPQSLGVLGRGYKAVAFSESVILNSFSSTRPIAGQAKSKASSLSSAEAGRLWEEPTEETGPKPGSVGILAI
jgi:hypothetical protein